jgi:predicted DNA binding protein
MDSLVEIRRHGVESTWDELIAAARKGTAITDFRAVASDEKRLLGIVRCRACNLCKQLVESDCFVTSVTSSDGSLEWTVRFDDPKRLAELVAGLNRRETTTSVRRVSRVPGASSLTPRQAEVLTLAYELGYFEFPKKVGVDALARRLGVAKSTVAETLHRAEKKALASAIAGGL